MNPDAVLAERRVLSFVFFMLVENLVRVWLSGEVRLREKNQPRIHLLLVMYLVLLWLEVRLNLLSQNVIPIANMFTIGHQHQSG